MSPLQRPFRPIDLAVTALESFDLNELAAQLVVEPQYDAQGRAGVALARDAQISVVLEAIRKGGELRAHKAPASAMVTLVSGKATFVSEGGAKRTDLAPGKLIAFAADLEHAVEADDDSVCLIVIGGRAGAN